MKNKSIIITGAAMGLGLAAAKELASRGANLALVDYNGEALEKAKYGRIVNVASVGGIRGVMNQTPYVASKHAVNGMTKNAALEYGRDGITTNAIAPGAILTPMVAEAFK